MSDATRTRQTRRCWRVTALTLALASLLGATRADEPATLRVPEDYRELRRALLAARAGDVIQLAAGRHEVGHVILDRAVVLRGAGPDKTILAGAATRGSPLYVSASATLEGFSLEGAPAEGQRHPLLTIVHEGAGQVTLRDLLLERAPGAGVVILGGAVVVDGLEVRGPGGPGVEVRRLNGDAFVPWPRPVLRRLVVRDAAAGVLLADGAGGLLEAPEITGSREADVQVTGALTCTRLVGCDALRVSYDDGAIAFQPFKEVQSRALEEAERTSFGEQGQAAFAAAREGANDVVASLTRTHREGLQADDEGRHAAALSDHARGLFERWGARGVSSHALGEALRYEVASFARRHGPGALARWLLTAPAVPDREHAGGCYLGGLTADERAAFTAAWLEERRAAVDALLAPLRGPEQLEADVTTAARTLVSTIAAVHSGRHALEAPPAPEAAASHGRVVEVLEAFLARHGGAAAGAALLDVAADPKHGGTAARVEALKGYLGRQRVREVEAWRREAPARLARERQERAAWLEARRRRLDADLTAAGDDLARVVEAYRACLVDVGAGVTLPLLPLEELAGRLRREHGVEAYVALYRALPERVAPDRDRDFLLRCVYDPAEKLAVLRALHRDEPWRLGPHLPTLRVPADHPTIQAAIDAAAPGQRIQVSRGEYAERLRLRPHTQLSGWEVRLLHDGEGPAVVIEECPGVSLTGVTVAPREGVRRSPREDAVVRVARSEVTLELSVLGAGEAVAMSLEDSVGTLRRSQLFGGREGLRVSGARGRFALEDVSMGNYTRALIVVSGGAALEVANCRLSPPPGGGGILALDPGSRVALAPPLRPTLVRYERGAQPDASAVQALAALQERLAAEREALHLAFVKRRAEVHVAAYEAAKGRDRLTDMVMEVQGYHGYVSLQQDVGKACAPTLGTFLAELHATGRADVPGDAARVDALIAAEARGFYQQYGVVPYARVLDRFCEARSGFEAARTTAGQEVPPGDEAARFHAFLSQEDRDYLAAWRRWCGRQFLREKRGEQRREPEPWPTSWVRHRIGGLPVSALFPGKAKDVAADDPAVDGQGIDLWTQHHASYWFRAGGDTRPVADAGQRVSDEQIEHILRVGLDGFASEAVSADEIVFVRELPAPYRMLAHRRIVVRRDDGRGELYKTDCLTVLQRPTGDHWQLRLTISSSEGHYEDEELLARFLRSLQFER